LALQLLDKVNVQISSDATTTPVQLAFSQQINITNNALIAQYEAADQTYTVGTHILPMGSISAGKFVWIYPKGTVDVGIIFNGGSDTIVFVKGEPTKMYVNFTSMSLVVTGSSQEVQLFYGGT
jgi:hypothetical protein